MRASASSAVHQAPAEDHHEHDQHDDRDDGAQRRDQPAQRAQQRSRRPLEILGELAFAVLHARREVKPAVQRVEERALTRGLQEGRRVLDQLAPLVDDRRDQREAEADDQAQQHQADDRDGQRPVHAPPLQHADRVIQRDGDHDRRADQRERDDGVKHGLDQPDDQQHAEADGEDRLQRHLGRPELAVGLFHVASLSNHGSRPARARPSSRRGRRRPKTRREGGPASRMALRPPRVPGGRAPGAAAPAPDRRAPAGSG